MKLPFCAACAATEDLQHHHLVTRKEGGKNDSANLITLCAACHDKLHERQRKGTYNHSKTIKEAIVRAKAQGKQFGRRPALDAGQRRKVAERHANGETIAALAQDYGVGVATIFRVLRPETP